MLSKSILKRYAVQCPTCKKCGGKMKPGQAIEETLVGVPDFIGSKGVCTVSPGGKGKLVDCWKCSVCGFSLT